MDRIFLDANVLVSAALKPEARLGDIWTLPDVRLLVSPYVIEEARRNTPGPCSERLELLLAAAVALPVEPDCSHLVERIQLPTKGLPVFAGALAAGATHLLTGDLRHFRHLMGVETCRVRVMLPGEYLQSRM